MGEKLRQPEDPLTEEARRYKGLLLKVYVWEVGSQRYLAKGDVEVKPGTQFGFSAEAEAETLEAAIQLGFQRGERETDKYLSDKN